MTQLERIDSLIAQCDEVIKRSEVLINQLDRVIKLRKKCKQV